MVLELAFGGGWSSMCATGRARSMTLGKGRTGLVDAMPTVTMHACLWMSITSPLLFICKGERPEAQFPRDPLPLPLPPPLDGHYLRLPDDQSLTKFKPPGSLFEALPSPLSSGIPSDLNVSCSAKPCPCAFIQPMDRPGIHGLASLRHQMVLLLLATATIRLGQSVGMRNLGPELV